MRSNSVPRQANLIRQKMMKNAKIEKLNATFWVIFKHCDLVATVLPDRSILIGQEWVENAKKSNATFWVIFKHCATGSMSLSLSGL